LATFLPIPARVLENKKIMTKKKTDKETELNEQLTALMAEKEELNDRFLRLYSEFENYKKRTNKEKIDLIATASERVILGLLPIVDDYERAMKHNQNVEDITILKEGFELIYNKLLALLKRFEVEEIMALGEIFDTDLHEAITHLPTNTEEEKGKIIDVIQKGYKLNDKVIRFAKVVVAI
jgi:molecular chaperone GrpE